MKNQKKNTFDLQSEITPSNPSLNVWFVHILRLKSIIFGFRLSTFSTQNTDFNVKKFCFYLLLSNIRHSDFRLTTIIRISECSFVNVCTTLLLKCIRKPQFHGIFGSHQYESFPTKLFLSFPTVVHTIKRINLKKQQR